MRQLLFFPGLSVVLPHASGTKHLPLLRHELNFAYADTRLIYRVLVQKISVFLNLRMWAEHIPQRHLDQLFLTENLRDGNAVHHPQNVLRDAYPNGTNAAIIVMDTTFKIARIPTTYILRCLEAAKRPANVAESDLLGRSC
jgi:hypothetical protein